MKYLIVVPDGSADDPIDSLGGKTPLEAAALPNIDALAARRYRTASARAATLPTCRSWATIRASI